MIDMNLGNANLKSVNASKPQLLHTPSKQSVTASDEYYSLSDYASDGSSADDRATIRRYQTPPSQTRSPNTSRDLLQSEATLPPARPAQAYQPNVNEGSIPARLHERHLIARKPIPAISTITWEMSRSDVSPPTPGTDDTPYIRFAIDQLTRDEELLGRSRQGVVSQDSDLIDRLTPVPRDEGPVYYEQGGLSGDKPVHQDNAVHLYPDPALRSSDPPLSDEVLRPVDPPHDTYRYPTLNFLPGVIRLVPLLSLILICILIIAGLIVCSVWSSKHNGLIEYDGVGTGRYFLFKFLAQSLAGIIVLWLLVVQAAVYRILPFTLLASSRTSQDSGVLYNVALFPTNFLIPNVSCFRHGDFLLGAFFVIVWLCLFTVPLTSALFQTRLYTPASQGVWRWTTVQPVAWILIALYVLLIIALLLLIVRFTRRVTGLKWDPVSLADIFVLLHRSNSLSDFDRTRETPSRNSMLGYWSTSNRPQDVFYGIGKENAPLRRYSLEKGKLKAMPSEATGINRRNLDLESQRPTYESRLDSSQTDVHSAAVRYRWIPWFLRETFVVAWIVIALVLMIAFVVASFVHRAVQSGFLPLLPAPTTSLGFSPANFLYSFLPSFIGMVLFLLWQPIDMYFRALEPFGNLANTHGAKAENSLLLGYTANLPVEVTVKAAIARHYKVAWISFISLLSITLPILGGGVFTAQFFIASQDIREAACMPAYYALVVFVIVYALSFLVAWPTRKRHLPHDIRTLADLISFVYQSPLLSDAVFREPRSKVDLVTRLISALPWEKQGGVSTSPRYTFGVYAGRDGREHLGIDRLRGVRSGEKVGSRIGQMI